ncbi:NAD(P)/FAD-dependent oxidoreductase [Streptomyces sp. HNM0574]|uniref:flavin-containing monooxygenase n=1 Tax=Streptomyces sp. HNM0574 TaxID=2714954 RepID=UPI00146C3EC8|nr:NAD(P)/FAD-dependent oxidoreductase [Streptomyces sp. HNM0574]NLU70899.1 NAD(P)/FAD-dependent oxidoreductase [Streptomyces sp. HNM0574]
MPVSDEGTPVHVIGAGPAGLATAAALRERRISSVVLEKSPSVGATWRAQYDRLRLHTTRRWSALPGLPIPRPAGRWVHRDDFVAYLERYTEHHGIEVATGVEVDTVERRGERWTLHANGGRRLTAPVVVIATGHSHTAHLPPWPGRESFTGDLLHASRYRSPGPYADRDVLVVGAGNTGTELALDLAEGGASRVRLAVRTPPHLTRRSTLGWPAQASGVLCRRLPAALADGLAARAPRSSATDLSAHGLPRPGTGPYTRAGQGAHPVRDTGFVRAVREGRVEVVAAVESFEGPAVRLADGEEIKPDTVVAATGYRSGLEELVGHLGVLGDDGLPLRPGPRAHPAAPGLFFTGFTHPVSGLLREIARTAPRVARAIDRATA